MLGAPAPPAAAPFPQLDHEWEPVRQMLAAHGLNGAAPLLAVHPWTSNPVKQWPVERFEALVEAMVSRAYGDVVIIGGPESPRWRMPRAASGRVMDLTGQLTLPQLAALLQRSRLVISNDSGPVHLAAAVGTRTLVLFGAADSSTGPRRWGPWGERHVVIARRTMQAITVDEVLEALDRALSQTVVTSA